jgi:hypothetical protein
VPDRSPHRNVDCRIVGNDREMDGDVCGVAATAGDALASRGSSNVSATDLEPSSALVASDETFCLPAASVKARDELAAS